MNKEIKNYERKISFGFLIAIITTFLISVIAFMAIRSVINSNQAVIHDHGKDLILLQELYVHIEKKVAHSRSYFITQNIKYRVELEARRATLKQTIGRLQENITRKEAKQLLRQVIEAEENHHHQLTAIMNGEIKGDLSSIFESYLKPKRDILDNHLKKINTYKKVIYKAAIKNATSNEEIAIRWISIAGLMAGFLGIVLSILIYRTLKEMRLLQKINSSQMMRLRNLLERSNVGIVIANFKDEVLEVNEAFSKMIGRSREELLSNYEIWQGLTPDEFKRDDENIIKKLLKFGYTAPYEKELIHLNAQRIRVLIGAGIIDSEKGEYALFIVDRTAQFSLEKHNEELRKVLQEAINSRDEFIKLASHELKTPLTSLKLRSQMIFRRAFALPSEEAISFIKFTVNHVNRINNVVEQMLNFSRIRSGNLELKLMKYSLRELTINAIEAVKASLDPNANIPEVSFSSDPQVECDQTLVEEVFKNLISNAIKYGLGNPIFIEVDQKSDSVIWRIKDHGMGLPEGFTEEAFNQYTRGVSLNEITGLGLGLYISKEFIQVHGGRIWAESKHKQGATFFVQLPLTQFKLVHQQVG